MPQSTVLTHGAFDLLHSNHIRSLQEAAAFGTRLIVAVGSDAQVASYKRRPVLDENERLAQVLAIRWVDEAFIDDDPVTAETLERQIQRYDPQHVVYFGEGFDDYFAPAIRRGLMRRRPYHAGISTSHIIAAMRARNDLGT